MRKPQKRRNKAALHADLEGIRRSADMPAPVCGEGCRRSKSPDCSRHCPDIPQALSSDPDNYPLEALIAPLVFELKRLGVYEPCWSCEGHLDADGNLWKVPRVWFYSDSTVHVRILSEGLRQLRIDDLLSVAWRVTVTHSDQDNVDTAFSLEPVLAGKPVALEALQRDIGVIAERIHDLVLEQAEKLNERIE